MYEPIDEKQVADFADNAGSLIQQLRRDGIISRECAASVSGKLNELFEAIRADDIPATDVTDEEFWERFQKLWGFSHVPEERRVIPMNAANLCPAPTLLIESIGELRSDYNLDVAQQKRMIDPETGKPGIRVRELRHARELIAAGIGLDDMADVAIVRNASEGNNLINCGYRNWRRSDDPSERENVVIWEENHPTNKEAWWLRAQWGASDDPSSRDDMLFEIREVAFDLEASEQEIASSFIDKIDSKTRFVTFSETSNGSGFRIPENVVKQVWEHVQTNRLNCHVHIDATMVWGARSINLRNPYCHSLVSSAHKWFVGPKETGILYVSHDKARNFMPSVFAYNEAISIPHPWTRMPATAQRFAMLGQRDDVNIINLALIQECWFLLSPRKPYERVAYLAQKLKEELVKSDWELITPVDPERSSGVARVKAPREDRSMNLYNWLYARQNGYRIAGSGGDANFRLCPHIYNTMSDVKRAVEGMNAWRNTKS